MAEKKEIQETAPETAEKTVTIRLPREFKDQEDKVVWVNARRFLIKRGIPVNVPESVASILENEDRMMMQRYAFEDAHTN